MGKKTKSKARLDKYYYLAKEHGFRSRAAFKLIQLNKKFHFLESANVLLDLCAAPGGWCQVAAKQMPVSSIKIGVDLDTIKSIPGVTTFQADITSEKCRHLIRKEIKHFKADVVLNDGAPNVGGLWSKDSYTQTELVLYAVKLATEFLREGGWFITKVFRSSDYNALIYVMRQLFNKVEATKPLASRSQAAEIFVVCSHYKAPSVIDPKLLDPKYALQQLEEEDEMKSNAVKSIKAIFEKKKQRSGYTHDSLYIEKSFKDFIECINPYQFLAETNKVKLKTEDCTRYLNTMKSPVDYQLYFDDLQLLGKKEVQELIIWRNKIRVKISAESRKLKMKEKAEEEGQAEDKAEPEENEEEANARVMENLEKDLKQYEKQRRKRMENERKKQERIQMKNKMAFIDQEENAPYDNDVEFDENVFEELRKNKVDIEQIGDDAGDEREDEGEFEEFEMEDLSDMDDEDYIEMMNEDIEQNKKLFEEEKGTRRKNKRKKKEKEDDITYVNQEEEGVGEEEKDDNDSDGESNSSSELYQEEDEGEDPLEIDDNDKEADLSIKEDEDEHNEMEDIKIVNPLRTAEKKEKEKKLLSKEPMPSQEKKEEDNLSSDTDEEGKHTKASSFKSKKDKSNPIAQAKDEQYLNKKTARKNSISSSSSGYNTDEKAEIRAIATKMLRKKDRLDILDKAYNRYVFTEDEKAPQWFLDEEKQHNVPNKPVTKAEILSERAYLRKINDRMPKKILEAKARKKNKLNKRLEKVKKKAEVISNQEEFNEFSKVKQIEKLYKKELARSKEKKKYVIARSFTKKTGKDTRTIKHVDRRLKKDKRAERARDKRNKKHKGRRH